MAEWLVMVPTVTGKPGKWESIFQSEKSQGILNILEKSGNCNQNTGSKGILANFYFFQDFLIELYLLNRFMYMLHSQILYNTGK